MLSSKLILSLPILAIVIWSIGGPAENTEDVKARKLHLSEIGCAMFDYMFQNKNERFPARALFDKNNKPLLSWRVILLPYLGEEELFKQFELSEPWDSDHNKKILKKMPAVYAPIGLNNSKIEEGTTYYQVFAGDGSAFDKSEGYKFKELMLGLSETVFVVESRSLVPWTKPEDLEFNKNKRLPSLGPLPNAGFYILLGSSDVRYVKPSFNEKAMKQAILRKSPNTIFDLAELDR